ncbi:MAG: ABC transporter substrate-binding protein [Candidatus Limnocylindria bacterium]
MRQLRRGRALIAVLAASLLVATACAQTSAPGASGTPAAAASAAASAAAKPVDGGRVISGSISDIATMQPVLVNDTASGEVTGLLYLGLIQVDPKSGKPLPNLASFTQSADGLSYTFEIDAKANWSDGKPVIAQDYLTGVMAVGKSKKTVRKSTFKDVKGFNDFAAGKADTISGIQIDPANPKKLTVTLDAVTCPALIQIGANNYVLPTQVFGKYVAKDAAAGAIDNAPENTNPQVTDGPFLFKEWRKGDQVILAKNPTYFKGAPHLDEYVFKVVASSDAITSGLKTGEITYGTVLAKDLADMQTVDTVQITKYPSLGYTFIGWDLHSKNSPGLADKRVRQALAYGLNMDQVIKSVVFGEAIAHVAHSVPVQWAYPDSSVALEPYKYDKAKAEQLLDAAGWVKGADGIRAKDGKKFTLTISTNSGNKERETLAQVAAEQYKQLGIDAKAAPEAFQGLVTKLVAGDTSLDATIIGWSLGAEPDPYQIWDSSQIPDPAKKKTGFGFTYFQDPAMDKAIEQGRNPSNGDCSIAARKKQYDIFNKILNENQPYNFGYVPNVLAVAQKTLQGFAPAPFSTTYNVEQWWIKK